MFVYCNTIFTLKSSGLYVDSQNKRYLFKNKVLFIKAWKGTFCSPPGSFPDSTSVSVVCLHAVGFLVVLVRSFEQSSVNHELRSTRSFENFFSFITVYANKPPPPLPAAAVRAPKLLLWRWLGARHRAADAEWTTTMRWNKISGRLAPASFPFYTSW